MLSTSIGSLIIIIIASIAIAGSSGFDNVGKGNTSSFAVILFLAISVFILSRIGCCGARRENKLCLYVYSAVMFAIFLAQFVVTLVLLTKSDRQIKEKFGSDFTKSFKRFEADAGVRRSFDIIQRYFECCGVESPADYSGDLPLSCCSKFVLVQCQKDQAYKRGCRELVENTIVKYTKNVAWTSSVFCCVELGAALCGLCLACNS